MNLRSTRQSIWDNLIDSAICYVCCEVYCISVTTDFTLKQPCKIKFILILILNVCCIRSLVYITDMFIQSSHVNSVFIQSSCQFSIGWMLTLQPAMFIHNDIVYNIYPIHSHHLSHKYDQMSNRYNLLMLATINQYHIHQS